jgi:hypothetical protein
MTNDIDAAELANNTSKTTEFPKPAITEESAETTNCKIKINLFTYLSI